MLLRHLILFLLLTLELTPPSLWLTPGRFIARLLAPVTLALAHLFRRLDVWFDWRFTSFVSFTSIAVDEKQVRVLNIQKFHLRDYD